MVNISPTIKINIYEKPGVEENITLGDQCTPKEIEAYTKLFKEVCNIFSWYYSEIPKLYPAIVEHHIDTWPNANHIHQKLRPINPFRQEVVKAIIDKLKQATFIYPIEYTTWVSNPVLVLKEQGTIHVYTNFHDLNKAFPNDNLPTPFIDQVIDKCAGHEVLSFMDDFSGYS